jgi:U3 small nucleolar RNA-associated protein 22
LFATKKCLEGLKPAPQVSAEKIGVLLSGWDTRNPGNSKLDFYPPTKISVVGSFLLDTMTKASRSIDLAITIPDECLVRKDYLNYRYHDKRLLYLAYVAKALVKKTELFGSVELSGLFNDTSKPVLVLRPAASQDALVAKFSIRLLPMISDEVFPVQRFRPEQNNVRPLWLHKSSHEGEEGEESQKVYPASPLYNMSILEDVSASSFQQQLVLLHQVQKLCPSFAPVCVLLKVWSRVHGVSKESSPDTFHEGLLGLLLAHLILDKQINHNMSVQQVFRSTIAYVAKTERLFLRCRPSPKSSPGTCFHSFVCFFATSSKGARRR